MGLSENVFTVRRLDEKWSESKVSINLGICYGNCKNKLSKVRKQFNVVNDKQFIEEE